MLTLLAVSFLTASAETPPESPTVEAPLRIVEVSPSLIRTLGRVTYNTDVLTLVPGVRTSAGTIANHGRGEVAVMFDGVPLLHDGRLGPLP